ncbi:hypothetical protein BH11PLA2_BH11PLA2_19910 [soil metagenome]
MRMLRLRWKFCLVAGLFAVVLVFLTMATVQKVRWVGHTDLEVEFVVTDATTGVPVPKAEIDIHSEGGFYEERELRDFKLVAGQDGRVSYLCRNSMCFGTSGHFTDTFAVHLPWWSFRVIADGYEPGDLTELDELEYRQQARRDDPGKAKLLVPVTLRKKSK